MDVIRRYNEMCEHERVGEVLRSKIESLIDVYWSAQANITVDYDTYPDALDRECRAHVVLDEEARRARAAGVEVAS